MARGDCSFIGLPIPAGIADSSRCVTAFAVTTGKRQLQSMHPEGMPEGCDRPNAR